MSSNSHRDWAFQERTSAQLNSLTLATFEKLAQSYEGKDRIVTPENVFQEAIERGRELVEEFQLALLRPGSRVEGLENLDDCLAQLTAGRSVLFLPDHFGNLDVPSFNALLRREEPRFHEVLRRIVYIAGRKLNESSDLMKMFSEKYARLVIVPKRDYPAAQPDETEQQRLEREEFERNAGRINRAAFRELTRLKKSGRILVLFPTGGRVKPGFDNQPVPEATSYMRRFDVTYLISMDGNTLPVRDRMEDERPVQQRVIFRVGPALESRAFLERQKEAFAQAQAAGEIDPALDEDMFAMQRVMAMLEHLRLHGSYGDDR